MRADTRDAAASLLAAIQSSITGKPDVVPKGWLSVNGWAAKWGKSGSHSIRLCRMATEAGLMDRRVFRVRGNDGVVRPVPHFKQASRVKI